MTISTRLADFVAALDGLGIDTLTVAVRDACARGEGVWIDPTDRHTQARPCTVQHEIEMMGVTAWGAEPEEAARNWLKRARLMIEAEAETRGIAA
jgi:hypothetical protein